MNINQSESPQQQLAHSQPASRGTAGMFNVCSQPASQPETTAYDQHHE